MKSFRNIIVAASVLSASLFVNAAAVDGATTVKSRTVTATQITSLSFVTATQITSASALPTQITSASAFPTQITSSSVSSPTGGFVVTGIFTTCLTVTFAAPTFGASGSNSICLPTVRYILLPFLVDSHTDNEGQLLPYIGHSFFRSPDWLGGDLHWLFRSSDWLGGDLHWLFRSPDWLGGDLHWLFRSSDWLGGDLHWLFRSYSHDVKPTGSVVISTGSDVATGTPVTSTVIASGSASNSPGNVIIFTTCLAFLPSATASATAFPSFSPTPLLPEHHYRQHTCRKQDFILSAQKNHDSDILVNPFQARVLFSGIQLWIWFPAWRSRTLIHPEYECAKIHTSLIAL
ncbi:hypothetical protein B0H13DRAFT_1864159 [Mycena leptocephala]|nr:hypothetical protein B0H13DRAFT_1864159 [Mycena leptocephala]